MDYFTIVNLQYTVKFAIKIQIAHDMEIFVFA
jgi:hypothetical protein